MIINNERLRASGATGEVDGNERKGIFMEDFEKIELRSEDVQEILGVPPKWIVRWGTTVIFFGVACLGVFSWFFKYADKIPSTISVSTVTPPVPVVARSTGYLAKLVVAEGDTVKRGDLLLILQNSAHYEDVLELENEINHMDSAQIFNPEGSLTFNPRPNLFLGDLQPSYSSFVQTYKEYTFKKAEKFGEKNVYQLEREKNNYNKLIDRENERAQTIRENLKMAREIYARKKKIYEEHDSPISLDELQNGYKEINRYEEELKNIETTKQQFQGNKLQIDKNVLEVRQNTKEGNTTKYFGLIENLNQLKTGIIRWKQIYLLTAPVDGKVSFFNNYLSEKQNIKEGDQALAIVPLNSDSIVGIISLPISESGRVKEGQRVVIKFDSYPYQQFGLVEGRIKSKALMPKDDKTISIRVGFPKGLTTSYKKELHFEQQMQGGAEIITEERRFIYRIFEKLVSGK